MDFDDSEKIGSSNPVYYTTVPLFETDFPVVSRGPIPPLVQDRMSLFSDRFDEGLCLFTGKYQGKERPARVPPPSSPLDYRLVLSHFGKLDRPIVVGRVTSPDRYGAVLHRYLVSMLRSPTPEGKIKTIEFLWIEALCDVDDTDLKWVPIVEVPRRRILPYLLGKRKKGNCNVKSPDD